MILERFKALIFDMDGTLVDSMPLHLAAWMATAQDGAGHGLLFALEHPHPLADLVGWPALLQDAGHPVIQAAVFLAADGLFATHVHAHSSL